MQFEMQNNKKKPKYQKKQIYRVCLKYFVF